MIPKNIRREHVLRATEESKIYGKRLYVAVAMLVYLRVLWDER